MFSTDRAAGVCRLRHPGARWLVTGPDGGYREGAAAYNVTVPEGFERTDLAAYGRERRTEAGFAEPGPTLLTGVEMRHARGARHGSVTVVATAGLSNPVALDGDADGEPAGESAGFHPGTVNLLVGTGRALSEGGLGTLLAEAVEVKAATLARATGFTGTTSDALAVGCVPDGEPATFAGSATAVGGSARVCVRAALEDALAARGSVPASVAAAEHGVVADGDPERFVPGT
jgi:adenosylcobinamide hydrolase